MTQAAKAQEPSMEEILASIRRIIADDDASKSAVRAPEPAKVEAQPVAPPPAPPPPPVFVAPPPPPPPAAVAEPDFETELPPAAESPVSFPSEPLEDPADILDLTESMAAALPPSPPPPRPVASIPTAMPNPVPQFRTIDGRPDVDFEETSERPAPSPGFAGYGEVERGRLVSNETSAAVDSAFNVLAQTVLAKNARTLEDLVRDMLRPMLKTWLDDNLPGMVERLVRAEIERVSRGRSS
ncbi:MAG: DUF2497 domain-containing protein [Xanthobacteraceae bacterium]|jgi:cell pole-organizing protein PopZ